MNDNSSKENQIKLWWECPNCKQKVYFEEHLKECFDASNGEAEFAVETGAGLWLHTIACNCGAKWTMNISGMILK